MTILKIDSSITGDESVSRQLTEQIVRQLRAARPESRLVERDLVAQPLDHLTLALFADTEVLDEFLAADTVVIGAPMYNFSIPSQLKAWIDRIAVAGKTFRYTENGPEGLAGGKRVIVALARGGTYDEGSPAAPMEHAQSYLRGIFNFIGIEPEFVAADGLALGPDERAQSIQRAIGESLLLAA